MDDIEMNDNSIFNNNDESSDKTSNQQKDYSSPILDNIEEELNKINILFSDSSKQIETFNPFPEKANNFDNNELTKKSYKSSINQYIQEINSHFNNILGLTNNLKQSEESNINNDKELNKQLEELKQKNERKSQKMKEQINSVRNVYNYLNVDKSMMQEINNREQLYDEIDEYL
mgnify:CR=1 FL=1